MKIGVVGIFYFALSVVAVFAEDGGTVLPLKEFVQIASQKDTVFEEILIDQLSLQYQNDLRLPAKDLVLDVKADYDLFLSQEREDSDVEMSLSKLFPRLGTDVAVTYSHSPAFRSDTADSDVEVLISQSIAQNAFGRATRLREKIIGLEVDVSRYQIVEAYEDYFASLVTLYLNWYAAFENLRVGEQSYRENLKLLDNILEREQQKIALPVDVNKVKLLVLSKQENVVELKEVLRRYQNLIYTAIRYDESKTLIPFNPDQDYEADIIFERDYPIFEQSSRTYQLLKMLLDKSALDVDKEADDLLPSISLNVGYRVDGDFWKVENEDNLLYGGVSLAWPLGDQVDRAEHQVAKIEFEKQSLSNQNTFFALKTSLHNLSLQMEREEELITIARQKIELAQAVLSDEAENYSFGKISLNDYIDAVNRVDEQKFNLTQHLVDRKKLIVEWLRLTDQLVHKNILSKDRASL